MNQPVRFRDFDYIRSLEELQGLVNKLLIDGKIVGFDVETGYHGDPVDKRSLDVFHPSQFVVGFSLTNDPSWARYVPLRHDDCAENLDPVSAWEIVRPVLETLELVCHHKKFEDKNLYLLHQKGDAKAPIRTLPGYDTMLDAYILSEWQGVQGSDGINAATGLKILSKKVLGHQMTELVELFEGELTKTAAKKIRFNVLPLTPKVVAYACDDSAIALELFNAIHSRATTMKLGMEWVPQGFIHQVETEISSILTDMEIHGVSVDWAAMEKEYAYFEPFQKAVLAAVKVGLGEMSGLDLTDLNVRSTKQMQELLYDKIGLTTTVKTGTGALSVGEQALEGLSRDHPTILKFLKYKQVMNLGERHHKWLTTYRDYPDGKVHAEYAQHVVASGRFSASDPSIQQLPKKWYFDTEIEGVDTGEVQVWKGNFRDYVVAAPGHTLLTFDFSQVELRVLAGVSGEPYLLQAFENGDDVHTLTAAMMLNKDPKDVDHETERPLGKTFNFALLYGMGLKSMAERLAISVDRARELNDNYFAQFTKVKKWMEDVTLDGIKSRFSYTPFGRRARVWELDDPRHFIAAKGERLLVNLPIQGGAADYMKIGMVRAAKALKKRGWWGNGVMLIMNQHDSLTFEVRNDFDLNEVREVIQNAVVFPVPGFPTIVADWEMGRSWGSSTEWPMDVRAEKNSDGTWSLPSADPDPSTVVPLFALEPVPEPEEVKSQPEVKDWVLHFPQMPTKEKLFRIVGEFSKHPGLSLVTLATPFGLVPTEILFEMSDELVEVVTALAPGVEFHPDYVDEEALKDFANNVVL